MPVFILAYRVDSLTYTLAKALAFGDHQVRVQGITDEHSCDLDRRLCDMLQATDGVSLSLSAFAAIPGKEDPLIVQGHPRIFARRKFFQEFSRNAKDLRIVSFGDRKFPLRKALGFQGRELRWYGSRLRRVSRVLYKDGYHPRDLYRFLRPRSIIGFDVHSRFLHDPGAFRAIHARNWKVEDTRPCLVNFLGSLDPRRRAMAVERAHQPLAQDHVHEALAARGKEIFWHAYTDEAPAALGQQEYLDVLTRSDFTVSPPGYSLVTHRPLEAMLRGSIPVLNDDEREIYGIGLEDGVNCVAVHEGRWDEAMERLLAFPEERIREMRGRIARMYQTHLEYNAASRLIRQHLGFD